ncbi:hypothetical protein MBLNU230_g1782t1 [Neophaeotheca triangularis]
MATQDDSGTAFSIMPEEEQQHFRLLELPPDLLSLFQSKATSSLQLKSTPGPPGQEMSGTAVLCTSDQTFNVRQVSTSNTVYITQPRHQPSPDVGTVRDFAGPGLSAIAQCDSTLELIPAKDVSAIPHLKASLPVYASTGHRDVDNRLSKQSLFDNVPVSQGQCEQGWTDLTCFELDDGGCFIPSAALRHETWRSMITQATADAWDFGKSHDDETGLLPEQAAEQPMELASAIARAIKNKDEAESYTVDRAKCVHFVGRTTLEFLTHVSPDGYVAINDFLKQWRTGLPEMWANDAAVDVLKGWYHLGENGKRVAFAHEGNSSIIGKDGVAIEGKSALGVKRKWHDKFRQSKKAG